MMIIYGWGDVVSKGKAMGIMPCDGCCGLTMHYLARQVFRVHICYIPVFRKTKKYLVICDNCNNGYEITKEAYKNLTAVHKTFCKKKDLLECYQYVDYLTANLINSAENAQWVLDKLKERYPIEEGIMSNQYRNLIETVLRNKQNIPVQINNQTEVQQ